LIEFVHFVDGVIPTLDHAHPDPEDVEGCHCEDRVGYEFVAACIGVFDEEGAFEGREDEPKVEASGDEEEDGHSGLAGIECHVDCRRDDC